jgi:hypothetical protein
LYEEVKSMHDKTLERFKTRKETNNLREGELKAVIARKLGDIDELKTNIANLRHKKKHNEKMRDI